MPFTLGPAVCCTSHVSNQSLFQIEQDLLSRAARQNIFFRAATQCCACVREHCLNPPQTYGYMASVCALTSLGQGGYVLSPLVQTLILEIPVPCVDHIFLQHLDAGVFCHLRIPYLFFCRGLNIRLLAPPDISLV